MRTRLTIPHTLCNDPACIQCRAAVLPAEDAESIRETRTVPGAKHRHPVRDFLQLHFPDYCALHQVPEGKLKTMRSLMACKTGELGFTVTQCPDCGHTEMHACACGNRNCPSCGYLKEQQWVEERRHEILPDIPYFHITFTLPHELSQLLYQNQIETLNLLFRSAKETILDLSRDKLKMVPGILMVLHTSGSNLSLHYHIHVLVSGGGLTLDKKQFKRCMANKFFLPAQAVSRLYRGKFLDGLKHLREDGKLQYFKSAEQYRSHYTWKDLLNTCYGKEWNVQINYLAPVSADEEGEETADNAAGYFGRYTNRTAISDSRIIRYDEEHIQFQYKDYHGSSYEVKLMSLSPEDFIHRFLMHILPPGFTRIRYAGFLASCVRRKNLELIHSLLGSQYHPSTVKGMSAAQLIHHFYGEDITVCTSCHGNLVFYPRMSQTSAGNLIRDA